MKDIPIIHTDADLLVVNKPAGIAVQGGAGITVTILDILARQTGEIVYPVHRLDRDTAGLLLVARSSQAAARCAQLMSEGALVKRYRAITFGVFPNAAGRIDTPVGRADQKKDARTEYAVEATSDLASLVSLTLGTGRMHQIRSHLAGIGCPIIADDKYGDFKKNREFRSSYGIRRLQLAAVDLTITLQGKPKRFTIPLPEHMESCCVALGIPLPLTE